MAIAEHTGHIGYLGSIKIIIDGFNTVASAEHIAHIGHIGCIERAEIQFL